MRALATALKPGDEVMLSGRRYVVQLQSGGRVALAVPDKPKRQKAEPEPSDSENA